MNRPLTATEDLAQISTLPVPLPAPLLNVRGLVKDENNEPLPGVSIVIKGTQRGAVSDQNGNFTLEVPSKESVLLFSFVGYLPREVTVGNQTFIEVSLQADVKSLSEVIVVGYGTVKKENLTSSISKIGTEAIENRPLTTLSDAFAGQLAGVRAQSVSGIPGQELQIRIRGVNTINGNSSPLYVIDGIPRDDMTDINPADVASIQILKDASATAIYGSRGANGVVLIETKRGTGKPSVTIDAFYGIQDPEKFVGMMSKDEWLAHAIWSRNDDWLRRGGSMKDPMSARPENLQIPQAWLDPNLKGVDWQKAITVNAPIQSYQVAVSGKNDLGSVYVSGGYLDQDGIIFNTYYRRFNLRFNGELNVGKRLKVGMNLSPSFSTQDDRDTQGKETVIHHAINQSPLVQLDQATRDFGYPAGLGQAYANPLERLKYTTDRTNRNRFISVVYAQLEILPKLFFKSQFGYNFNQSNYEYFQPGNVVYNRGFVTQGNSNSTTGREWSIQNTLAYDKSFGPHNFDFLAGFSAEDRNFYRIQATANGWPNEIIETLNVATNAHRCLHGSLYLAHCVAVWPDRLQLQGKVPRQRHHSPRWLVALRHQQQVGDFPGDFGGLETQRGELPARGHLAHAAETSRGLGYFGQRPHRQLRLHLETAGEQHQLGRRRGGRTDSCQYREPRPAVGVHHDARLWA